MAGISLMMVLSSSFTTLCVLYSRLALTTCCRCGRSHCGSCCCFLRLCYFLHLIGCRIVLSSQNRSLQLYNGLVDLLPKERDRIHMSVLWDRSPEWIIIISFKFTGGFNRYLSVATYLIAGPPWDQRSHQVCPQS